MAERLPSPEEQRWEDKVAELELIMLDRLREHAEKWRAGLTALTALVATAGAVAAPFVGTYLPAEDKTALGLTALLGVVALAIGAMSAMRAAYGLPTTILNTGTALREWTIGEVTTSACWLRVARGATIVGFTALVVAAAIGYVLAGGPAHRLANIEPVEGGPVCGTLTTGGEKLTVTAEDGTVHRFDLADVRAIDDTEVC